MARIERILRIVAHLSEHGQITTGRAHRLYGDGLEKRTVQEDLERIAACWDRCRRVEEGRDSRWVLEPAATAAGLAWLDRLAMDLGRAHMAFLEQTRLSHPDRADPRRTAWKHQGYDQKLYFLQEPARPYDEHAEVLSDVLDALFQDLQLSVRYRESDGTERRLEGQVVLTLVVYRRAVYALLSPSGGAVEPVCVPVDRMEETEVHERAALRPPDWDPRRHFRHAFGVRLDRPPERVVLRFSPKVAAYVRARQWHPSEEKVGLPDGGVELRMRAAGRELVRFALEWGPNCLVVEPAWLRDEVVAELRAAVGMYGGP